MKALLVGNINTIFTYEFAMEVLLKLGYEVDILQALPQSQTKKEFLSDLINMGCRVFFPKEPTETRRFEKVQPFLYMNGFKRFSVCKGYGLICIHYVRNNSWAASVFSGKSARIVTSYYGSDLLRVSNASRLLAKPLLKRSNVITMETDYVKKRYREIYHDSEINKVKLIHLGSVAAGYMNEAFKTLSKTECKRHFDIPGDKISILCGYNGYREHRHLDIISSLSKLSLDEKSRIYLLFHFGYAFDEAYYREVQAQLESSGIRGHIYDEYFHKEKMALFRKGTDIMLNLQPTDAISNSMLECLASGAVVIKGKWLKYPELEKENRFLLDAESVESLYNLIHEVINDFERYEKRTMANLDILTGYTWESQFEKWRAILSGG